MGKEIADLRMYKALSRLTWPTSYAGKFLLISFIGIHVPLIALIFYLIPSDAPSDLVISVLLIALGATLGGMIATLWVQSKLLNPLSKSSTALQEYVDSQQLPSLPTHFTDEAGTLMANLQHCLSKMDDLLTLKNDLLSILSHDARSPVNSIILAQELLEQEIDEEKIDLDEVRSYINIIRKSANHQLELMNNILTIARMDADSKDVSKEEIPFKRIIESVIDTNELHLKNKTQTFETKIDELENAVIYADEIKFKAVLNNLVQNAIKFTNENGRIEIEAEKQDQKVLIKVTDNGIGIEESKYPMLFKRSSESHQRGTQQEKGTGLGLWICKVFTELNGGTIDVESEVGKGSTFILSFDKREILVN